MSTNKNSELKIYEEGYREGWINCRKSYRRLGSQIVSEIRLLEDSLYFSIMKREAQKDEEVEKDQNAKREEGIQIGGNSCPECGFERVTSVKELAEISDDGKVICLFFGPSRSYYFMKEKGKWCRFIWRAVSCEFIMLDTVEPKIESAEKAEEMRFSERHLFSEDLKTGEFSKTSLVANPWP